MAASSSKAPTTTSGGQSSSSTSFNEDNFMRKLDGVTPTQDSIQTLALWIIHHKNQHDVICRLWLKKLREQSSGVKHRLALFYLANDVIQNCKRKNAKVYQDTFRKHLADAINLVKHESINKNIERVLDVWEERNVYEKEFNDELRKHLRAESKLSPKEQPAPPRAAPPAPAKIVQEEPKNDATLEQLIANFQPKMLCESITAFNSVVSDTNLAKMSVEATRILDVNIDTIRQYRDRNQCIKFKAEFENSIVKLEEYIKKLSYLASQRKKLVELMEQGELFYDAQFNDATRVFNAYRVYGLKVHAVKNKLDEAMNERYLNDTKFDSVDMEMSDDDANNEKENSKYNNSYRGSSGFARTNSSGSAGGSGSIRTNLDPRQNRTPSSSSKRSSHYGADGGSGGGGGYESQYANSTGSSSSSSRRKHHQEHESSSSSSHSHKSKERDRSGTPVRDETPSAGSAAQASNPLDFLTKFINKSSNGPPPPTTTTTAEANNTTSKNLSFIFNQLQKIVNNPAPSSAALGSSVMVLPGGSGEGAIDPPPHFQHGHHFNGMPYYDPGGGMPYAPAATFMINPGQQPGQQQAPPRPGTPTKDELYPAPPSIQFAQVPAPPMLPSPNAPGAYNPIMAPPINSLPPSPYHPMYQPQLLQPNLGLPPPQLMIDPNSSAGFNQNYMFNQPPPQVSPHGYYPTPSGQAKVLVSPVSVQSGNQFWPQQLDKDAAGNVLNDSMMNKYNGVDKSDVASALGGRKVSSSGDANEPYSPQDHRHFSRHSSNSLSPPDKSRYQGGPKSNSSSSNKYTPTSSSSSGYKRKYSNEEYGGEHDEADYDSYQKKEPYGGRPGSQRSDATSRHHSGGGGGNGQPHRHY